MIIKLAEVGETENVKNKKTVVDGNVISQKQLLEILENKEIRLKKLSEEDGIISYKTLTKLEG